jgi:penicillin amidase
MKTFIVRIVGGLMLLGAALFLGAVGLAPVPPLGPVLDPANGVWAVARAARPLSGSVRITALEQPVDVVIDRRGVPHIYASTELDAHRALGYLVARDRLFQLELQTRAGSGRLTEWIGAAGLESDREARRLGFPRLVERSVARADTTAEGYRAVRAYADGVNAWIDRMSRADLPLEFRLLRKRPERWDVANTYYLLARMALTLAYNDPSLLKADAAARVGWVAADALFPVNAPIQEPIQPNSVDAPRYAFAPIPPPGPGDSAAAVTVALAARAFSATRARGEEAVGSNNFAVAPEKTAAGHALLAGDPHLELTLPSIWYQVHLVVPGRLDVQGVTLPGAPWVTIGFNRDIAWSFTNTGSDVNDYYRETVDDRDRPTRYQVDGEWQPLDVRVEAYRGPRGDTLAVDTMRFTHRGPLVPVDSTWLSMAWTVYAGRSSADLFVRANRARTAGEFLEAMQAYDSPAQNMLVADRRGTIAIRSTGRYPTRPGAGRGDVIWDGSRSASDWTGSLPIELYPFSLNPLRGFLSSANQQPVDPLMNPSYLGAHWYSPWRALRINALLRADATVTPDELRRVQIDHTSARALAFLPLLLGPAADSGSTRASAADAAEARRLLRDWNGRYDRENRRAVLFEAVMRELVRRTWDELAPAGAPPDSAYPAPKPEDAVLLALFEDSTNAWWDHRGTPDRVERRDDIIDRALAAGLARARREHGEPDGEGWRWGAVHQANIHHLLRIPAFGALGLPVDAGPSAVNPSSGRGTAGASWRMVVELGSEIAAWATYPGGQSGNPASPHYADFLPVWREGRLDSLISPAAATEFSAGSIESRVRFRPGR